MEVRELSASLAHASRSKPLAKAITIKPEELIARAYADRLILAQLSELDSVIKLGELADRLGGAGLGLAAVRSLLASNPERFAYHERKWIPAARVEGQNRPFAEGVRLVLDRFGAPIDRAALVTEVARINHKSKEEVENAMDRLLERNQEFLQLDSGQIALATWGFMATDQTTERAFGLFGVTSEEVEGLRKKLDGIDWHADDAAEKALKAAAPASAKVIGAVAWTTLYNQDPRAVVTYNGRSLFSALLSVPGYVFGGDGVLYPEADAKKWLSAAVKLAERLAPTVDVEDAAPIEVKVDDIGKMIDRVVKSDASVTATKLLEDFYEITPSNKTFPDDMANVIAALQGESKVWWVGADRFRKPSSAPDFIESVPEPFQYVQSDALNEDGDPIDVELNDDGLSSTLRKLLQHPLAMDVLDEDIMPTPKTQQEKVRLVLKSVHRELGTFPMAQLPTGFLDAEPGIQELIFVDQMGNELQVWANQSARLMYGLIDWWYEQPIESGAVFTLTKTAKLNVFDFAWDEQTDPVVFISGQRMEELRNIQSESEGKTTLDLLIAVMAHWPKGADFLTLLAEVNVIRRSTRRLIASLLSSYQCFYQRSGSPVWHFDAKKVDLGFDKTKKKFIKK